MKPEITSTQDSSELIKGYAYKKGTTIILDVDGTSQEAKIETPYSYDPEPAILPLVAPILEQKNKPLLLEIIKKVFEDGGLLLKVDKESALKSYQQYLSQNPNQKTLAFFENIISKDDYLALKMSLYLRSESEKGKNIFSYKNDIRNKFGERGANIANLCTAGYFESEFMPLYNEVDRKNFDEYYELAVGKKARALFIHSGMSKEDIEKSFDGMLLKALNYHMVDFRIHGIGTVNVSVIKEFINTKPTSSEDKFVIQKGYEKTNPPVIEYIVMIVK